MEYLFLRNSRRIKGVDGLHKTGRFCTVRNMRPEFPPKSVHLKANPCHQN